MLNHAKPASASGWKVGAMLVPRLPPSKPPPCTRMAAGNGPGPSGTCRSRSNGWPPGLANSTPFWSAGASRRPVAQSAANITDFMDGNCSSCASLRHLVCSVTNVSAEPEPPDSSEDHREDVRPVRTAPPGVPETRGLLSLAVAVIVVAALYVARDVLIPMTLA